MLSYTMLHLKLTVMPSSKRLSIFLTPNKNTVLHIHFTAEIIHESNDFMKYIMKLCPSIVRQANAKGETPLHIAARNGHSAAVKFLMEHSSPELSMKKTRRVRSQLTKSL